MPRLSTIDLLVPEPEVAQFLSADERGELGQLMVPVELLGKGPTDLGEVLEERGAFGAFVLEGMLLQRLRVDDHLGLRVLGPGEVFSSRQQQRSMLLSHMDCHVAVDATLALLGREVLAAARRLPQLIAGLHACTAAQSDRLAVQLVICQLPRVEDRLMAMLWLLAESWGRVTPAGTSLPVALTHDLLGGLVGARRSTVTLALRELSDRGSLIRQDAGWLLLDPPPSVRAAADVPPAELPVWLEPGGEWAARELAVERSAAHREELLQTVARLREEHERNRAKIRVQLEQLIRSRERRALEVTRERNGEATPRRLPFRTPRAPS